MTDLFDQRITQQNKGKLINFHVKFYFSNNTSQTVTDFPSFLSFREHNKIICTQLDVSWIYLLSFEDKKVPEKQEINIKFVSRENSIRRLKGMNIISSMMYDNLIKYEIRYTARTWGIDIESLLRNYLDNFIKEDNKVVKFVKHNSEKIGLLVFLLIIISYIIGFVTALNNYTSKMLVKISNPDLTQTEKLENIANMIANGFWDKFSILSFISLTCVIIVAIMLSLWVSDTLEFDEISYLLFSDESQKEKEKIEKRRRKQWMMFFLSIITSIGCGILSNLIFKIIFKS